MRHIHRALLGAFFALLVLGADAPIPIGSHAGTQADPDLVYNSETVAVVFDDTYTPANVTLARIDVEILSEAGAAVAVWSLTTGWTLTGSSWRVPIRAQATTLENGSYQVRVRAWDNYGNVSAWSTTMWVSKQWRTIPAPGGCRTVS